MSLEWSEIASKLTTKKGRTENTAHGLQAQARYANINKMRTKKERIGEEALADDDDFSGLYQVVNFVPVTTLFW
ncbi:hypothetical protein BOTNAR_0241g00110 [Botryotinia narcissicola]|uniref:Uncharacterized protein n=1 Tax=Botryotinia narcissicola TaxID=278944 RepID=A0A4Z1I4J2_9HELO|nr:hypothetical protein BOTNAR_0241g00110 [Botryotinia narcissicola]